MQRLTEEAGMLVRASVRESKKVLEAARRSRSRVKGVSRAGRARAIAALQQAVELSERIVHQVKMRFAGERIPERLVSMFDPDARPVRRGKVSKPTEFGYVVQLTQLTPSTKKGARGPLVPPKLRAGSTHENALLPETLAESAGLGVSPKEASFDAGFVPA